MSGLVDEKFFTKTQLVEEVILRNKLKFTKNFSKYVDNPLCSDIKFILKDKETCHGHSFVLSQYNLKIKDSMNFPTLSKVSNSTLKIEKLFEWFALSLHWRN
jgi:hypothetical protein